MEKKELEFPNFARLVIDANEEIDIEYLIGGAVAVWAWGDLRTTSDLDVVINLPGDRIIPLSKELKKRDMLVPPDIIIDLLIQPEGDLPVNAIHLYTGHKAELFLLREGDAYRKVALSRRQRVDLGPPLGNVYVHSPEDLILNKVLYFGLSAQTKHIRDIGSIFINSSDKLDLDYINQWAIRLGISHVWHEVSQEIEHIEY